MTFRSADAWRWAWGEWRRVGGSAKFLFGSHQDRQTGALKAHPYRQALGYLWPPKPDRALLHTRGSDGLDREESYRKHTLQDFIPHAERIRRGSWKPGLAKIVWQPKSSGKGLRPITIYTAIDRTILSVLAEIIEVVIDPLLSVYQHGYRASWIQGTHFSLPGFSAPRGSTEVVAQRLYRSVCSDHRCFGMYDIVNAFPSVDRRILRRDLIESGCPKSFAEEIERALGREAVDTRTGRKIQLEGIPQGSNLAPLLFNFYVRGLHTGDSARGLLEISYSDNLFFTALEHNALESALQRSRTYLKKRGMEIEGQTIDLLRGAPRKIEVLREWEIEIPGEEDGNGGEEKEEGKHEKKPKLRHKPKRRDKKCQPPRRQEGAPAEGPDRIPAGLGIRTSGEGSRQPDGIRYDHQPKLGIDRDLAGGHTGDDRPAIAGAHGSGPSPDRGRKSP